MLLINGIVVAVVFVIVRSLVKLIIRIREMTVDIKKSKTKTKNGVACTV